MKVLLGKDGLIVAAVLLLSVVQINAAAYVRVRRDDVSVQSNPEEPSSATSAADAAAVPEQPANQEVAAVSGCGGSTCDDGGGESSTELEESGGSSFLDKIPIVGQPIKKFMAYAVSIFMKFDKMTFHLPSKALGMFLPCSLLGTCSDETEVDGSSDMFTRVISAIPSVLLPSPIKNLLLMMEHMIKVLVF